MLRQSCFLWRRRLGGPRVPSLAARSFFSFPNPLTNPDALTKTHQETKIVPFSPEDMYDVVADVDRYREFLPFCVDSKVLRRPNDNVMEASLRIGFKVFTEAYTSRVIMKRPEKIVIKSIESPTFKRIERYAIRGWPGVPGTEC
jgi:coenzyme Q-binding protein COQ10